MRACTACAILGPSTFVCNIRYHLTSRHTVAAAQRAQPVNGVTFVMTTSIPCVEPISNLQTTQLCYELSIWTKKHANKSVRKKGSHEAQRRERLLEGASGSVTRVVRVVPVCGCHNAGDGGGNGVGGGRSDRVCGDGRDSRNCGGCESGRLHRCRRSY